MILLSYYFHFFCHCASIWFVICQRGLIQNNCKNNMKQYLPVSLGAGSSLFSTPCCWNLSGSDSWLTTSSLLVSHALKQTVIRRRLKTIKPSSGSAILLSRIDFVCLEFATICRSEREEGGPVRGQRQQQQPGQSHHREAIQGKREREIESDTVHRDT